MKFIKGAVVGTMLSVGIMWALKENGNMSKKNMMKKGKKFLKEISR